MLHRHCCREVPAVPALLKSALPVGYGRAALVAVRQRPGLDVVVANHRRVSDAAHKVDPLERKRLRSPLQRRTVCQEGRVFENGAVPVAKSPGPGEMLARKVLAIDRNASRHGVMALEPIDHSQYIILR
eukprot:4984141-Prymnesium_polylepis.1